MAQGQDSHMQWHQSIQDGEVMGGVGMGEDEFTKFLDLDNDMMQFEGMQHSTTGLDTPMGKMNFGHHQQSMDFGEHSFNGHPNVHMNMPSVTSANMAPVFENVSSTNILPSQAHGYDGYSQYQQMAMQNGYRVPPTPVSSEMHAAKYGQRMDNSGHLIYDNNQVSFTPLVSPAQTPLDNGFCMPEYVVAEDFFSPLTSPAIEAQSGFSTTTTASPVDLNNDIPTGSKHTNPRRPRRKPSTGNALRTPARSVKQSPAMKPQTRARHAPISAPAKTIETVVEQSRQGPILSSASAHTATTTGSDVSVSPELLSEALMGPPPVPHGHSKSPPGSGVSQSQELNGPATPATLMRIQSKQSTNGAMPAEAQLGDEDIMEDMTLPESAQAPPLRVLPRIDTNKANEEDESTPILSAKAAKFSASSTPRMAALKAQTGGSDSPVDMKFDARGSGRAKKKRQSTSSAAISPALRPKISPSISPLVPATGPGMPILSAETSALYLASKSNYQNILEGTHLPGVSYPETLAENLSSKRTSHKIAEQGRRNRINLALKEIEALLPLSINTQKKERKDSIDDDATDKASAAAQGASKASTVEMAIIYIKSLQAELKETKDKLDVVEKRLADGSSGGSHTSE